MEISLEKILMGILIGILLFCIGNKMFTVEGVTNDFCNLDEPCKSQGCIYDLEGCSNTGKDFYGGVGCIGNTGCRFCDKPSHRKPDHKPCGSTTPSPPSPSPYHPPSPPSPPTPPAPPTDNICSKLKAAACKVDPRGNIYGCANKESLASDAKLGDVYSCNDTVDFNGCQRLIQQNNPFVWCPAPGDHHPTEPDPNNYRQVPYKEDIPNRNPPSEFSGGFIEYKNDHDTKKIIVWFDFEKDKGTDYNNPSTKFWSGTGITENLKIVDSNGRSKQLSNMRRDRNGFILSPGDSLFFRLNGVSTHIESGGNWFTSDAVTSSKSNPGVNRYEYTINYPDGEEGDKMYFGNYSYVDGYNSYFTLKLSKNNGKYSQFGNKSCNLSNLSKTTCNLNGGQYGYITPDEIGGAIWQPVCRSPTKVHAPTQKGANDPIGCNNIQNILPNYACNCLQTWYSKPGTKYYVGAELMKWWNYIHRECNPGYAWSYHEKEPIDFNDDLYNDPEWCSKRIQNSKIKRPEELRTWAQIAEYFKNYGKEIDGSGGPLFIEPPVLSSTTIKQNDIIKILVSIKDVM